jgi:hypothetical protein
MSVLKAECQYSQMFAREAMKYCLFFPVNYGLFSRQINHCEKLWEFVLDNLTNDRECVYNTAYWIPPCPLIFQLK